MINLTTRIDQQVAKIELAGRFDFNGRKTLREGYDPLLANPEVKTIEVSLAGVDYVDSSALGILLLMKERAEATGKKIVLVSPRGTVAQVLEVANFKKLFQIKER